MAVEIEGLEFQIEAKSENAAKGVDALVNSFNKLKAATKGGAGLNNISKKLDAISNAKLSMSGIEKIEDLTKSLNSLSNVKISSTISKRITEIGASLDGLNRSSVENVEALSTALQNMQGIQIPNMRNLTGNQTATPAGTATPAAAATNATSATNATNIKSSPSTSKAYVLGTTTTGSATNKATVYNNSVYTEGSVLYGAAWNDYAEYRRQEQKLLPGFCVKSTDNGILNYTTKRLEPCEGVVSDTFGFAIGETDECKTPLAVAGRVLVYTEEDREHFHSGDAVCASVNGRVSKMTREEIKEYPDRIIGIVSEIPYYETWGEGNIAVNNRIWIKVK